MVSNQKQGWAVLAVMGVLFLAGTVACYAAEAHGNDALNALGLTGGNMEGKEVRFGIVASALFAVITTAASCGAVNAMHDSFTALGAALTNVFGRMVGNQRQGWAILAAMGVLFLAGVTVTYWAEANGTTALDALGLTGGNMEGKEVRFGIIGSALFAVVTTDASCGAVNAMHDSFTALGGMIPLINMQLGEIIVGGVGAGLYGMLIFVIISIFVAGLMVGRTPEYVGKKIEAREVKMAMLAILVLPLMYLGWTAVGVVLPSAVASMNNAGPHGFTEVLYAYTSSTGNNGSAFAGLSGNTFFYNLTLASAMFVGRFFMIVPAMAIAGSLAGKKSHPPSAGTFPTTGGLFVGLVVGVILIIGGLTFFPALALGPIVEHLAMNAGTLY